MSERIGLHIYDIDGTLLDSMRMWDRLSSEYLSRKGIDAPDDLAETLDPMTMPEAAGYMIKTFGLPVTVDQVLDEMIEMIRDHYRYDIPLFEGIEEELREVSSEGVPMVLLTNTPRDMVEPALERTKIAGFFEGIYTTEMGLAKDDPEIFRYVCREMGVPTVETLVHEDSSFAIQAAREAGCMVKEYDRYRGSHML
jgi:HAD superfamily hydrolase (TIGR01509 family)